MIDGDVHKIDKFDAPFGKEVELQNVCLENDVRFLRLRIKEGSRFTILDLDPVTAKHWGELMVSWSTDDAVSEKGNL